jgi:hypothetical protein
MCGEHLLPDAGGVLDQDAELMARMRSMRFVYRTLNQLRDAVGADIHRLSTNQRLLIRKLREDGYLG